MVRKGKSGIPVTERLRAIDATILPLEGAWVVIRGNHTGLTAKRGLRIPQAIRMEGVKHFDIYWAYNEECPWKWDARESLDGDEVDLVDDVLYRSHTNEDQLTWVTLHTPSSEHIRMWAGEVTVFSRGLIDELLQENYVETVSFTKITKEPIWDDFTRDMVGSLRLDGLSLQEAQDMLITTREMKAKDRKVAFPDYFYRPIVGSPYYNQFCEEPEYEAWWKDKMEGTDVHRS